MRKRVSNKPKMAGSWSTRQFSDADGNKVRTAYLQQMFLESDYLPDRRVRTEENSYCEDDCRVLNEGKFLGCPTVVYSMKENFLGALLSCPD